MHAPTLLTFVAMLAVECPALAQQLPSDPPAMSVSEFKQQQRTLVGTLVAVKGRIDCSGIQICYLNGGNGQIVFDGSRTVGNDQERLVGCNSPLVANQCPATVVGMAQSTYNPSIVANHIVWPSNYRPSPSIPRNCPERLPNGRCAGPYGFGGPY